jgi:hypothetical protein
MVNSINYVEDNTKKDKEESLFSRLFKWWVYIFRFFV